MKKWILFVLSIPLLTLAALLPFLTTGQAAPLWLIIAYAACAAALGGWLFVLRKVKSSAMRCIMRILAVTCAALLCACVVETTVCNHRSFLVSPYETEELDLAYSMDHYGNYPSMDGEPVQVVPNDANTFTLTFSDLYLDATSLHVELSGSAVPVDVTVSLTDESSAYEYVDAAHVQCVPSDPATSSFDCSLYSNGLMGSLQLAIKVDRSLNPEIWIESVTLNPEPPPITIQPIRLAVCFAACWLLWCLVMLPWRQTAYQSKRFSHRLAFVIPMIVLMVLYSSLALHSLPPVEDDPTRGLFKGLTVEEATHGFADPYAKLFAAFQAGQVALLDEPSEELLSLTNPYDPSERAAENVPFYFDYALYEGQYFVYFGLAPLLLVYYPFYWLTGLLPSLNLANLILALACIPLAFYAVCGFVRRYVRRPNLLLLVLGCITVTLTGFGPNLVTSASRYENVVLANLAMMAGAVGFGFHGVMHRHPVRRILCFVLCGLCFGMQGLARPNTLFITTALLAPAFVSVLMERSATWRCKLRDAGCFLLPALALIGVAMAYNHARFGSVAEFGQVHQLTMDDIHYSFFRLEYIPQALYHYLFPMPQIKDVFPYVIVNDIFTNVTGHYFWHFNSVGLLCYPLCWLLLCLRPALRAGSEDLRTLRIERRFATAIPLVVTLVLIIISYFYGGVLQRYSFDFVFIFALLSAFVGLALTATDEPDTPAQRCVQGLFVLACVLSCILGVLFGFENECHYISRFDPEWFVRLVRMFYPY